MQNWLLTNYTFTDSFTTTPTPVHDNCNLLLLYSVTVTAHMQITWTSLTTLHSHKPLLITNLTSLAMCLLLCHHFLICVCICKCLFFVLLCIVLLCFVHGNVGKAHAHTHTHTHTHTNMRISKQLLTRTAIHNHPTIAPFKFLSWYIRGTGFQTESKKFGNHLLKACIYNALWTYLQCIIMHL